LETTPPGLAVERSLAADFADLAKPRLSGLVVVTSGLGYLFAARGFASPLTLLATCAGTFLLSGGACAMNHWLESDVDARMHRTRERPIPAGRLAPATVLLFSLALLATGTILLYAGVNGLTTALGLLAAIVYVAIYTPLKRVTTLNTLAGAIVGALPPMMGWSAATGRIEFGAFVLGAFLFVWQIPHFLAIAWMYRDDYRRGRLRMLPVVDDDGTTTARMVFLYSLALIPVSLVATGVRPTGWLYPVGALALGLWFAWLGLRLHRERSRSAARRVFFASIIYLPLLFILMAFDPTGGIAP
jgi:protoheme IX farnesyltransferase